MPRITGHEPDSAATPAEHPQKPSIEPEPATLLNLLGSPACLLDRIGDVTHLNPAWQHHAGPMSGTGARLPWARLIHPDDNQIALSHLESTVTTGEKSDFECRIINSDGLYRWFTLSIFSAVNTSSARDQWICLATDIHNLKTRKDHLEKHSSMQTDMLNISVDCIKLISLAGILINVNKAGRRALGIGDDAPLGMPWLPLLPEDVWPVGEQALASVRGGIFARFPGRSVIAGQKPQHWDNMLTPIIDKNGRPTAILCVSREVTAERDALESLRQNQERLALAAHVGGLGIWDYDIPHDTLTCDNNWYRIMGRDPTHPIVSMHEFRPFIHPDDVSRATEVVETAAELLAAQRDYAIIFRIIRPNGEIRWVRSAACLQEVAGIPVRAVGFVVDITDAWRGELALRDANRALEDEKSSLTRQSLEDPLTGIANRRALDAELARLCGQANAARSMLCMGMIDVDHFKAYNDRYGHVEGDAALRMIAGALQSAIRKSDFIARYGGEEFVFILPGTRDATFMLERVIAAVTELAIPHENSPTGHLTVSCGCIAVPSRGNISPLALLRQSDEALYEAKMCGRNRHVTHPFNPPAILSSLAG